MRFYILAALLAILPAQADETPAERQSRTALIVSSLGDPAKLESLTSRGGAANRLVKICFYLHEAKTAGISPDSVVAAAVKAWGWEGNAKGELTAASILHAFSELGEFGCFDLPEDRDSLKRGARPSIRRGQYSGESIEMDHIVPVALAPEWTQVIANLQPLPESVNRLKSDSVDETVEHHRERLLAAGF